MTGVQTCALPIYPALWLQSFGISPQPSKHWKILSLGDGGFTAAPWWFGIALAIGMVLVTLRTRRTQVRIFGVIGLLVLSYAMIVSVFELVPFGEREARPLWVGPTLVVATCIAVIVVADGADGLLTRLQQTPLSRIHFESLVIATSMFVCALSGGIWLAASQFSASEEKTTPLHIACQAGRLECVKLLVENGANVTAADKSGATPVFVAAWKGHVECLKHLIGSNKLTLPADLNTADEIGRAHV